MPEVTPDDDAVARRLATEAGELLVALRDRLGAAGATSATLRAQGDRRSHELLVARLGELRPRDRIRSEEGAEEPGAAHGSGRVWIVDPLDGTREFGEGRDDWAVHVALVSDGAPSAGAVALPALGRVLGTDDAPAVPPPPDRLRVVVSRTRPPAEALAIAEALGAELVAMGSAGAKIAAVIEGRADVYPHAGGQYEWDSCAPVAVAVAAGLHCSRLDGSPLRYDRADPWLPDLLVCRPEHVAMVRRALTERAL